MSVHVTLREVVDSDLPDFFRHMSDPESNRIAAFTCEDPTDRAYFDAHWARIRASDAVIRTVIADDVVVGHASVYGPPEEREVTYFIDRAYWGRGVATAALRALIELVPQRPLHARRSRQRGLDQGPSEVRLHRHRQGPGLRACPRRGDRRGAPHPGGLTPLPRTAERDRRSAGGAGLREPGA